jgi:hypothetical protein
VLRALLIAVSLEGVLPGLTRVRRPVPVVRFGRLRDRRLLRSLARHLSATPPAPAPRMVADWRLCETRSGGGGTGASVAFFRTG